MKTLEMTGMRFGRWVVLEFAGIRSKNAIWKCRCDCGVEREVIGQVLRCGDSKSCGCLQKELNRQPKRHGQCFTSEYNSWNSMLERCRRESHKSYKAYGGRGIGVCEEWDPKITKDAASNFLRDMGPKPSPEHSLERKDNSLGYSPSNCIWGTRAQQGINRRNVIRVEFQGEPYSIHGLGKRLGMSPATIKYWLIKGKSAEWIANRASGA